MSKCLLMSVLLAAATWQPVAAQVHKCTTPEGMDIFTDRQCADVGAVEQPPKTAPAAGSRERSGGCARSLRDLVQELNGAFDARDANRLAGVYNWNGMSGSAAYAALERLDAMVQRPLVGIYPVMPSEPAEMLSTEAGTDDGTEPAPPPRPRQAPVALRVEQTLANGSTPSRTVFGLQKYFGCWWIKG
ncbi:hypothetical protein HIV01_017590 [Lysobacter arenosi]|uniref:DUF4124 domain-containing protein n=1 Tax=Lysobacter arenosi TaxID=2795387 RepID=A0ABX7RAA5_9GAMM|nr:hypothetical protein [Lysobacter arenosi]QSX74925.1 hypothetical protein HIV01_017590 [Lysobacter arenosi]